MNYTEKISNDLMKAMLAKEKVKLETLRAVKTAFTLARSEKGVDYALTEAEELKILQKLVKQRKESAAIYKEQNRPELCEKELLEASIIETYLPVMMDNTELEGYIKQLIAKTSAAGMKDMGKVMGIATKELAGKADGKAISETVKRLLS